MRKQYTVEQREQLVAEVRATGERVSVAAKRLGVSASTAYLWMSGTSPAAPVASKPVFARVMPTQSVAPSPLVLDVGGVKVRLETGFDVDLLRQVVAALKAST